MKTTKGRRPSKTTRPAEPMPPTSTNGAPSGASPAGIPSEPSWEWESVKQLEESGFPFPPSWIYAQVAANTIPHVKVGKYLLFRRSEILAWLETHRRGPRPE